MTPPNWFPVDESDEWDADEDSDRRCEAMTETAS